MAQLLFLVGFISNKKGVIRSSQNNLSVYMELIATVKLSHETRQIPRYSGDMETIILKNQHYHIQLNKFASSNTIPLDLMCSDFVCIVWSRY